MKNKIKKYIFIILLGLQVVIIAMFLSKLFYHEDVKQVRSDYPTDQIVNGVVIGQQFKSSSDNLSAIEIFVDTKDRKNRSNITIDIIDQEGNKVVRSITQNAKNFKNNSYVKFDFEPISDSKNKSYLLEVKSSNEDINKAIALMATDKDSYKDGNLFVNNIEQQKDIRFKTYYSEPVVNRIINVIKNSYINGKVILSIIVLCFIYINSILYMLISKVLGSNTKLQEKLFEVKEKDNKFIKHIKDKKYFYIGLSVIFIYVLPYFVLGENSFVLIHDNLDSNVTWYKILAESGQYFGGVNAEIPNLIDGLPRSSLGSELFFVRLLYLIFTPFQSYVINQIIMRVVAYIGMILLLRTYVNKENNLITYGVAICFALLPFWPSAGLSIAGQPLTLWAFLKIRENKATLKHWIILPIVAMYSSLVLAFSFFLVAVGLIWLIDLIRYKKLNLRFLMAIILMGVCFLLVEYMLVYSMFLGSDYVSHRTEWQLSKATLRTCIERVFENFTEGQYQAASLHKYFINISVIVSIIIMFMRKKINKIVIIMLSLLAGISVFYGFWEFKAFGPIKDKISLLATFRFSRFNWLQATMWHILFAISLVIIGKYIVGKIRKESSVKISQTLILLIIAGQIGFAFYKSDFNTELLRNNPTFKEFYAEDLMKEIKDYIGKDQSTYKVISVGLEPAISQYNGFHTLDGYLPNYPLEYKHKFREIIKYELDKNKNAKSYYDTWGSKFFIFPNELYSQFSSINNNYIISKNSTQALDNLKLNVEALKELKAQYIFSAVPINNAKENSLELLKVFDKEEYYWKVYLYELKQEVEE